MPSLEVNEKKQNDVMIVFIKGELDSNSSNMFEDRLLGLIHAGETRFVLSCEEVDYISSAGFRVLLKAVKELKRHNGQLHVCAIKDYIREVFDLSGFDSFLPIHPSLDESLRVMAGQ